jgi:hypothetical protein
VHLLRARPAQCTGALVDRRARRVDVVDERQPGRAGARLERATHVAPARGRVETALRAHRTAAPDQRQHGQVPPAPQCGSELRGRIGAAQQHAIAHRGHRGEGVDRRARHLVGDERGREVRG